MAKKNTTIWLCENCGNEFSTWSGRCSMCGEWNALKELKIEVGKGKTEHRKDEVITQKISEIETSQGNRKSSGISEFDRVLGGGIVPGEIILIGGEPGIGKSTIILEVASKLENTFYLSAEESVSQIKIRADRLGIKSGDITLSSEPDLEAVLATARKTKPDLLIVDSIQTVYSSNYDSTPGSIVQVRECGIILQQFAKSTGIPVIVIGHVTKEGNLAGPRILEHLVDAVLYLEGDRFSDARVLRGIKNRFGATNEVGIFSMTEKGMMEIKNPSELFLGERKNSPGSAIAITLEGTRPILVEVQALVVSTNFGYPKRTSSGFDLNRLNLLAAVISKKTNFNLSNCDIYLNVVGGIRISEPAVDLAVCASMISSYRDKKYAPNQAFVGEVGLLGEVRKVARQSDRQKEASNLGFELNEKIHDLSDLNSLLN